MEQVLARRQPPHHLAGLHQADAYHALRPPWGPCRLAGAPLVRERRQQQSSGTKVKIVQTTAAAPSKTRSAANACRGSKPRQRGPPPSPEVADGERDGEGGDRRGPDEAGHEVEHDEGEEDAEGQEHHQAVVPVVVVRRRRRFRSTVAAVAVEQHIVLA